MKLLPGRLLQKQLVTTRTTITKTTTEEEAVPYVTPSITPKTETIFELTTSKIAGKEKEREQLLQRVKDLEEREREINQLEEDLEDREKKLNKEKEEHRKMIERMKINVTTVRIATVTTTLVTTLDTEITTESLSTTISIETTSFYTTEETTSTTTETVKETTEYYTTEESTITIDKFTTLPTTTFSTITILIVTTMSEMEYDKEIKSLKEKLQKERELQERERLLLERKKKLEDDIAEFEKYKKEFKEEEITTSTISTEKSTVSINLTTPIPPIEKTTTKVYITTETEKTTEKKVYEITTEIITTKHIPKEIVTEEIEEIEEIVTKRICLNVFENATIPLDKRKGIIIKRLCLPYFPEKNEKKTVGRLSRKLFALQNTKKIKKSNFDSPLQSRSISSERKSLREKMKTTRKISHLQLHHYEWLNKSTKPLQHFKGFTRIYEKKPKPSYITSTKTCITTTINAQKNFINNSHSENPLHERQVLDNYENFFSSTTKSTNAENEECRYEKTFFRCNLNLERESNLSRDDKINVEKREALSIKKNNRFRSIEDKANISNQRKKKVSEENLDENDIRSYTVNVLYLAYDKDNETYELVSVKPSKDELKVIIPESHNDNYINEENEIITNEYEEKDLKKEDDKIKKENDYVEDMTESKEES